MKLIRKNLNSLKSYTWKVTKYEFKSITTTLSINLILISACFI